jgi:TolB protein
LLPALRPVSGSIIFADIRPADVNGEEFRSLEIVSLNLDTWTETQLTQEPTANNSYPVASPDGRWIAYQSDRDGDFDIFIMNRLGGQQRRLTTNNHMDRLAGWSPDGQWIVYSSDEAGDELYTLRRVSVDGNNDEEILDTGQRMSHPRYSPDGRYLIFTMGPEPRDARTWEIARLDTETGELVTLTNNNVRDASPVFSPDGQSILYITYDSGSNAIARMDLDGGNARILYDTSASDWSAAYSPDGQYIVFTSNVSDQDQLYLMTAEGNSVQQITSGGGLFASWIPGQ